MALEVLTKFAFYASSVFQGLFDIVTGKEEYIYDGQGKVVAKLPSKRKQVLAFLKIFLKEPVSASHQFQIYCIFFFENFVLFLSEKKI